MTIEEKVRIEDEIRTTANPLVPEDFVLMVSLVKKVGRKSDSYDANAIRSAVLTYLNIDLSEALMKCRKPEKVLNRKLICYCLKTYTSLSLIDIAEYSGYKDHTGVLHHLRDLQDLIETDDRIREQVFDLHRYIETNVKL